MAAPVVGGSWSAHFTGVASAEIDISAVPVGGWMVVSVMASVTGSYDLTPPAGWTPVISELGTGTRENYLFIKMKTSEDGASATFTNSNLSASGAYAFLWGTGGADVTLWDFGTSWRRGFDSTEPTGSRVSNVAPAVTTTEDESLVLAFSNEATNLMVAQDEIVSVTPDGEWNEEVYAQQVGAGDRIETAWIASKTMATAGSSGNVTVTYSSVQDNNGLGFQLAIPPETVTQTDAPRIVGTPQSFIGSTAQGISNIAIPRPIGVLDGDYIVVYLRNQNATVGVVPTATGFTHLGPAFVPNSSSFRVNSYFGHAVTDAASEPANYTFSINSTTGSGRCIAIAFIVRGVDLTNPVAGFLDSYSGSSVLGGGGATIGRQVDQYSVDETPVLSLFATGAEFSANNNHAPVSYPSGYTEVSQAATSANLASSRTYTWIGAQEFDTTLIPAASLTWGTPSSSAAQGISLRGIASEAPDLTGPGYVTANGSGDETRLYYTSADGPRTPTAVNPMRRGFNTVSEAMAVYGATWAHRGGSASYPEMSLHAYTQSVARGYGILEVSLARTSDGVWFGLHDQTTDRTSGGTFGNASSQTWAQIQAQQNVAGPGAPQPYMRWEELVAAYGDTHILVVDPKYALGSHRTEFLNMVYNDVGPDRAIIKYSGSGSNATALSTTAQGMGFETWGFFYAEDASIVQGGNGNLQTWGPYWTIIGMAYGASQAIWDEALALGKPVIGHITPTQQAYDTAMSKGAWAVQVSGVAVVEPVSWWNTTP